MNELAGAPGTQVRRVNVVGTSSSGKTTFARALAVLLDLPHVELDALHWGKNWSPATRDEMRERVAAVAAADAWVIDGNYSVARDLVWSRAELVVWLDYPLRTVLGRYVTRTRRRIRDDEEIWPGTGNRERLSMHLLGRGSLLWWILSTYHRRRREYPGLLAAHPQIASVRLRSPAEAEAWLTRVESESG